ncbi:GIY-YIG nuclease family protein [Streptomyces capitiformicae]|uniref:GIY-YIG nuclease family protein n=1 Tax=Streptomyces capitiformicae TaxID=2014920 RepID=UPI00167650E8|nr:GIY-YIG nuclease family protein [Streptomyces capitiformicae]
MFYVVADEINGVVKFGITSGDPRPRLGDHSRDGFDCVIRLVEGLPGDVALRLEKTILAALRDAREAPVRGREYFPARVLPLITDLVDGWTKTTPTPVSKPVQLSLNIAA